MIKLMKGSRREKKMAARLSMSCFSVSFVLCHCLAVYLDTQLMCDLCFNLFWVCKCMAVKMVLKNQ